MFGKRLHSYGKIHHFSWVNPLFQWAMFNSFLCVYQRVYLYKYGNYDYNYGYNYGYNHSYNYDYNMLYTMKESEDI